uniref:C1orf74 homolog n=1 Tax=Esox lucius TaxID=8010 RepID=C1BXV0_ESOLU|nr:C1orf74 homolog [Esox lucius]
MASPELFVTAARKCLRTGKKHLADTVCLNLAAQVLAVDLGLKPALLYDSNTASAEQVQNYLKSLQAAQLVSQSLQTMVLCDNSLIVNPSLTITNLKELLVRRTVTVVDVCHSLEQPVITELPWKAIGDTIQTLLDHMKQSGQLLEMGSSPHCVEKRHCESWNLCTLFGILLGYPTTYRFDRSKSFENCLAMTPLVVTKAMASWQAGSVAVEGHKYCLYSFSTPEVLCAETQPVLDNWIAQLQEYFQKQTVFSGLSVTRSTVTLPSVAL